ncbi:MAG: PA14 domain-containing protein [Planctomycetota bacterium]|nr:PA14 domain-containing protein [Planctomycetota bacterium]
MRGCALRRVLFLVPVGLLAAPGIPRHGQDTFLDRVLAASRRSDAGFSRETALGAVDALCLEVRRRAGKDPSPEGWVDALVHVFFDQKRFHSAGDIADSSSLFLPAVLQRGSGSCLGLSSLALVVGERLGIPLHGVPVPNHYFVRFDDGKIRINIEMTRQGERLSDDWYVRNKRIHAQAIRDGVYLKNATPDETLGAILQNWALSDCSPKGNRRQALGVIEEAIRLAPSLPEARRTRGLLLAKSGKEKKAVEALQEAITLHPNDMEAHLNRGIARYSLGDVAGALFDIDRAIEIDPQYEPALRRREEVEAEVRVRHFDVWQARVVARNQRHDGKVRPGLQGDYFSGKRFKERVTRRIDRKLEFDWKSVSPARGVPSSPFSVRWTGFLKTPYEATYTVYAAYNDGVRLSIDGRLLVDDWNHHGWENMYERAEVTLSAGYHDFQLELFNDRGGSRILFFLASDKSEKRLDTSQVFFHLPEKGK